MITKETNPAPNKVVVVGMGISGRSVCELLLRQNSQVIATDIRGRDQFNGALDSLEEKGCLLRLAAHSPQDFLAADQIIVSPGVPLDIEPLQEAAKKGIEIIGELEWAWRQVKIPVVAVTGTNGKTTTTSLIGEMLKTSGKNVFVGGNIGTPLSKWLLNSQNAEVLVLEVSSFQLDTASKFSPQVGVLLNTTEDHLDRYDGFAGYVRSKFSLFARQHPSDIAIINADDPICLDGSSEIKSRLLLFSRKDHPVQATVQGRQLMINIPWQAPFTLSLEGTHLQGIHNEENMLAAVLASTVMNAAPSAIQEVIHSHRGLPHRVEWVRAWRGIDFYDDSKGTNVGAVVKAIENFDRPILLLLGGRDKLGSYRPIAEALQTRGKGVFVFGEAAPRIHQELKAWLPTQSFPDLEAAFEEVMKHAVAGDAVLLSPACSSFDQYESYAQRGDHFKRLAMELSGQQKGFQ
jgi:UDP-N-acetylmuramoylalanine--D-glutamate ligase